MSSILRTSGPSIFDTAFFADKGHVRADAADGLRALASALRGAPEPQGIARLSPAATTGHDLAALASSAGLARQEPAAFRAVATSDDPASVVVDSFARPARARSQGFDSVDEALRAATLTVGVEGASYSVGVAEGSTLGDVAESLRGLGAPIDVDIVNDGEKYYLQVRSRQTGYAIGGSPDDTLTIHEAVTGAEGSQLGLAVDEEARNAVLHVDGRAVVRRSNLVEDAVLGTTLRLDEHGARVLANPKSEGSPGGPGRSYLVNVTSLARRAEVETRLFASAEETVKAGTLKLSVDGKSYDVSIADGDTLATVRRRIDATGAPVATELEEGPDGVRLGIRARQSGYRLGTSADDALSVSEVSTGGTGTALDASLKQSAQNAVVNVNGARLESRTNSVVGAVPGFALDLKATSTKPELFTAPLTASRAPANVENEVNRLIQTQLLSAHPIGLPDDVKEDDALLKMEADQKAKKSSHLPPNGGTESSREEILQKLTAVEDIFGGLKTATGFLGRQATLA